MKQLKIYNGLPIQVKASLWGLICGVLNKGISVITTPIFTRMLSTEEYGQYSVFTSWMSIILIIVSFNLSYGVFSQGLVKFEKKKSEFVSSLQGLSFSLFVAWSLIYIIFKDFWNSLFGLTTVQMLSMLLMIWLGSIFGFWNAEQKNEYKYKSLVTLTLIVSVFSPLLSIFLIKNSNDKVTARILGSLIIEFAVYIWLFFIQLKKGKKFFNSFFWKYAFLFNLPLVPHYLSQVVLASSDRIMIEKMIGKSEAGIYSLAYSLSMIMLIINIALMQTISPWTYKNIKLKNNKGIAPVAYSTLIGVAIVNIILIAVAPEAVKIFSPSEYHDAIWIVPPVAISVFYIYSYDLFAAFAFYYEKQKWITFSSIIGALLNIILNYICIKKFGYIAAGYTTLVCYIIYAFCHYQIMNRVCDKCCGGNRPYNGKIIFLISAVFTVSGLAMLLTYNHIIIRYSVIGIIAIVCLIMHKKIISFFKRILSLKNSD